MTQESPLGGTEFVRSLTSDRPTMNSAPCSGDVALDGTVVCTDSRRVINGPTPTPATPNETSKSDESRLRKLLRRRAEAVRVRDFNRVVNSYASDVVLFDAIEPTSTQQSEIVTIGSAPVVFFRRAHRIHGSTPEHHDFQRPGVLSLD